MFTSMIARLFQRRLILRWYLPMLLLALFASVTQPVPFALGQAATATPAPEEEPAPALATASASASLVEPGRALVTARNNYWVIDSVPPLGGPNEAMNPLDALFSALATCGMFIYETGAQELDMSLSNIHVTAEGDLAPQGVRDGSVDPRIRAFRVLIEAEGISAEEADELQARFETRCPIYTTLVLAAPIEVIHVGLDTEAARLLEIDFTYTGSAEEYTAAVSPLAAEFAKVNGLRWKIWGINEENQRASGVLYFDTARAMDAFLASELAAKVTGNPAFSDLRVASFSVMAPETAITRGPITLNSIALGDATAPGVMLEVNFAYNVTQEEFAAEVGPLAEAYATIEGMRWKVWTLDTENSQFSAVFLFEDAAAAQAFLDGELAANILSHPALSDFNVMSYDVMGAESAITHAPLGSVEE
jgi:uncharacterized OsmC-like protein